MDDNEMRVTFRGRYYVVRVEQPWSDDSYANRFGEVELHGELPAYGEYGEYGAACGTEAEAFADGVQRIVEEA